MLRSGACSAAGAGRRGDLRLFFEDPMWGQDVVQDVAQDVTQWSASLPLDAIGGGECARRAQFMALGQDRAGGPWCQFCRHNMQAQTEHGSWSPAHHMPRSVSMQGPGVVFV